MTHPLGRREPSTWEHMRAYPLAAALPSVPTPGVLGCNWYSNFDNPELIGRTYWIGRGNLGTVRGGHCICAKPFGVSDSKGWWRFYDQGSEGACVGFGESRMMSLLNRERYDAKWLYHTAQQYDEYPDTPPAEGTSVRAGLNVLRVLGHERVYRGVTQPVELSNGISAYRWALSWSEVRSTLGIPDNMDGVPLLNSWGESYPHIVRLDDAAGERLLNEAGEFGVPIDL